MTSYDKRFKEIRNGVIHLDRDNNIIRFDKKPEIKHSNYDGTIELYHELSNLNSRRLPTLLNFKGLERMSMDCRLFLMNRIFDVSDRVAVVIDKESTLMHQFNTANHFTNKPFQISIHHSEEEAIKWLNNAK